jgi:hypothetical protein
MSITRRILGKSAPHFSAGALAILAVISGCKQGPTLVGSWSPTASSTADARARYTFYENGTMASSQDGHEGRGTYKLEDEKITITFTDISTQGLSEEDARTVRYWIGKPLSGILQWDDSDHVTMTLARLPHPLQRDPK